MTTMCQDVMVLEIGFPFMNSLVDKIGHKTIGKSTLQFLLMPLEEDDVLNFSFL